MATTKIIRLLVNKITPQKWTIQLEVNLTESLKPLEVVKMNKSCVTDTDNFNIMT